MMDWANTKMEVIERIEQTLEKFRFLKWYYGGFVVYEDKKKCQRQSFKEFAQSFQVIHVIFFVTMKIISVVKKNNSQNLSPWVPTGEEEAIITPL